jgi:suppressor of fused-like protein
MTDAPGWDAIDAELSRVYGEAEPEHYAPEVPSRLGGEEPLDGISAYRVWHPVPHWHLVSYGMSELYEKESDDATTSGWGFEFTLRLARSADQATPPAWSLRLLQQLAGYVFDNARPFAPGHTMNPGGPLTGDESTRLAALAFTADTGLQPIDTPHGRLMFLQVVGLTLDEYEAAREWRTESFLEVLARTIPGLITDTTRTSVLRDPALAREVTEGIARDGSSTAMVATAGIDWSITDEAVTLELDPMLRPHLARLLTGRLGFHRPLRIRSPFAEVELVTGDALVAADKDGARLDLTIPAWAVRDLAAAMDGDQERILGTSPPLRIKSMWLGA